MPKSSKPKKKQGKKADIQVGNNVTGNVVSGNSNTISYNNIIQPAPLPETHDALGSVPPASADTYVYRGRIEEEIRAALRKGGANAIVGLHAPGGTGKTELAKQVAAEVHNGEFDFEDVLWVDVNDKMPSEVLNETLRACGLQIQPNATDVDKKTELHHFLLSRKLLVVLDDVRENAAKGLRDILPPAPCAALVTSRIQQMAGVRDFPLDRMDPAQARELFINILGEAAVHAEEETAAKLAERCKYNPLALEIAARRIRQNQKIANPILKYFEKVEKRFEELKMHGDERWNLTAVFDLSYNDLTEADQRYFRSMAVFAPSGFAPQAAAHVWGLEEAAAGEIIYRFINLSLVIPVEGDYERYRLHDLLDEYASLKLLAAREEEKTVLSLSDWLYDLFENNYTLKVESIPIIKPEFDNLEKTLLWAAANEKGELTAKLATQPRNWLMNYFREYDKWQVWLVDSLDIGFEDAGLKANVRKAIGDVQQFRDERDAALESYNEALKLFKEIGDRLGEANVLQSHGKLLIFSQKPKEGLEMLQAALNIYEEIGSIPSQANIYFFLGQLLASNGQKEKAIELLEQAVKLGNKIDPNHPVSIYMQQFLDQVKNS